MLVSVPMPLPPPPPPRPIRIGRLRIVQDGAQDCSTCQNVNNCWRPKKNTITPHDVVSNLLVCRIQRGIDRNKSTKLFLDLIRPKVRKMAGWVRAMTGMLLSEAMAEMESVAIESILSSYVMGELAPPLVWLFHPKYGSVRHWAVRTVDRMSRERESVVNYGSIGMDSDARATGTDLEERLAILNRQVTNSRIQSAPPPVVEESEEPDPALEERFRRALEIVEDGVTLSAVEYRVMRFCLTNARGHERMTDWLHQQMARALGMPRKDVSRVYAIASRKLIEAVGLRERFLRARGIEPPRERRTDRSRPLTADEVVLALSLLETARGRATVLDVAFALGVTDGTLHQLRRRFGGMSPDQVRATLRKKS